VPGAVFSLLSEHTSIVDLISTLLLKMRHLSAVCSAPDSRLQVVPLPDMIDAAFGRFVSGNINILREVALFLTQGTPSPQDNAATALESLISTVNSAPWDEYEYLEQIGKTLDELLAISVAVPGKYVTNARLKLTTPRIFRFLQCLYIGSVSESPIIILVGAIPKAQELLRIPLNVGRPLEQLELAYAATDPNPRIRTGYLGIRLPRRNERQLLADWETIKISEDNKIEMNVYQSPIPGATLCGSIAVERIGFPHTVQSSNIYVQVETDKTMAKGIRTSITRQPGGSLLIVDKFVMS
jgi:hypothetical protein